MSIYKQIYQDRPVTAANQSEKGGDQQPELQGFINSASHLTSFALSFIQNQTDTCLTRASLPPPAGKALF